MIILDDELPQPQRVTLDRGDPANGIGPAWIDVRACTTLEFNVARERVRPLVAALVLGRRSEDELAVLLGAEFGEPHGDNDIAFASAAAERLALIEIVTVCATAWGGIGRADGQPRELNRANIARLLRVPAYAEAIGTVVNAVQVKRLAEGNASAASPTGGAAAAGDGATTAPAPESDAPSADA